MESLSVQNVFSPELFLSLSSKNPQCILSSWYSAVFLGVRKMTKEQHNQENVILNLACLYDTVEKGAAIPSQSPFPFPIASFSLVALSLLGGFGNLTVGSCSEHTYQTHISTPKCSFKEGSRINIKIPTFPINLTALPGAKNYLN